MEDVLEIHGTVIEGGDLKPINIVQAAEEDFKRRTRNAERQSGARGGVGNPDFEHFAFHRKHVHKANSAVELIELALKFQSIGTESGKKNTRVIYRNAPLLQEALELTKKPENTEVVKEG